MVFFQKHKNDILLVLVILAVAAALLIWRAASRDVGAEVEVQVDGALLMTLPLDRDTELVLGEGDRTNTLVIRDGEAFVTAADCPDHVCIRRGAIRYNGESIVCLPHKLVITVVGGQSGGTDITAQ